MTLARAFSGALASRAVLRVVGADASSMLQVRLRCGTARFIVFTRRRARATTHPRCTDASVVLFSHVLRATQSSVTNDVHALCAERLASAYAAVLTPKGKIFIDVFITRLDDEASGEKIGFLLDVDRARVDEVRFG